MIKKIFSLAVIALIVLSCGNKSKKEASSGAVSESVKVEFASLISNPSDYVGKNIIVEGKVVHVCKMSGKKLFITGENPDVRLYIQAGEEMPKFPVELLGSEVIVEGTLTQPVTMAMAGEEGMQEGEGMNAGKGMAMALGADTCETAKALSSQPVLSDLVMIYNKHTVIK
jgi:hypothetical protein